MGVVKSHPHPYINLPSYAFVPVGVLFISSPWIYKVLPAVFHENDYIYKIPPKSLRDWSKADRTFPLWTWIKRFYPTKQ